MQDTIINFYSTSDDYGDFSNFAAWPIKVDGKVSWPTSEHYFQLHKNPLMKNTAKRSVGFLPLWSPHAWGAIVLSLCVKTGSRSKNR